MTEDQEREAFEKACVVKFAMWRAEGNKLNDNGCPTTRESLCWRDEQGNYGVAMLNAAWFGWRTRAARCVNAGAFQPVRPQQEDPDIANRG